jgi:pSer/pThr/pTyr-binding forkhead associated (FHA) protein
MPYLIHKDVDGSVVQYWNLHEGPLTVGRGEEAEARIDDGELSRKHFVIAKQGSAFLIKDLGSKNGTLVNDKTVTEQALQPNDLIRAGRSTFTFLEGLSTLGGKIEKDIEDLKKFKPKTKS